MEPAAGVQMALMQRTAGMCMGENGMEGVCIPAASLSRAENWAFP